MINLYDIIVRALRSNVSRSLTTMFTYRTVCLLVLVIGVSCPLLRAQDEPNRTPRDSAALESEAIFMNDGSYTGEALSSDYFIAVESDPQSYEGEYEFGDSEWEWTLTIKVVSGKTTAKYRYGRWDKKFENWRTITRTVKAASIDHFLFKGLGFNGVFVRHRTSGAMGLVLTSGHVAHAPEVGLREK